MVGVLPLKRFAGAGEMNFAYVWEGMKWYNWVMGRYEGVYLCYGEV